MGIEAFFERGKGYGVFLDEYQGKYKLNAGSRKEGKDNLEWVIISEWDAEKRSYEFGNAKRPMSIYLGDREAAIKALQFFLNELTGENQQTPQAPDQGDPVQGEPDQNIPF